MKPTSFVAMVMTCGALWAAPTPGLAQDDRPGPPRERGQERMMLLLDTDRDDKISAAEIAAEQKRLLAAADVDSDGKLSVDEFRRRGRWFRSIGTTTLFDLMDSDGDQALTLEEIQAPSRRWLKRYDANGDDSIEAGEFAPRRWHRRPRR